MFQDNWSDIEITGSWSFHYNSWKNGIQKIPRIIIRYEDLLSNSLETFTNVIVFLSNILNFKADLEKIKSSNELSSFESLSKYEKKEKFIENKSKTNFFRTGKSGNWEKILSKDQIKKIEKNFEKEMKELNYL